ncbi:MAG: molybdopterin molybdotransferase MoeA [Bacteroidales bacterium]|nr:molybdopterin molybdotransferase MoeA [Bacteroidales bacterium]
MILFEKAHDIVLKSANVIGTETVNINTSLNRILAKDVYSDIDMPPFNKSAMDGFACRRKDIDEELEIIETIPAGKSPEKTITQGKCARIMTGAIIPDGTDCVVIVENIEHIGDNIIKVITHSNRNNISYKAEDIKTGALVLNKNTLIKPQHIAIMATVGCTKPVVYKQPKVGVISTGSELVEPDKKPGLSQIRNSNGSQIIAQIKNSFAIPVYYGIAEDSEEITFNTIKKALSECNVVLLTGGVSMGDYDFVPDVLKRANIKILFNQLAVQPGKPTTFGLNKNKIVFGLPGNPVSSFIQFELLVKPLLFKTMGYNYNPVIIKLPMSTEYKRQSTKRKGIIPVQITKEGTISPNEYHGSAHINSLTFADGIIFIPIGKSSLKKGKIVDVQLL